MKNIFTILFMGIIGLTLASCSTDSGNSGETRPMMTGTVSFSGDTVLPRSAMLTVRLLDVTREGAPSSVLAERSRSNPGSSPVSFELPYPYGGITASRRFVIEARIEVEGRLKYYSMEPHVVTPTNASKPHHIVVENAEGNLTNGD